MKSNQKQKAMTLLSLHCGQDLLVLPNVWNAIGARILEKNGFPAVATSSSAIAASLGYDDGEKIRKTTAIDVIERIARSVEVPVTADIETGFGASLCDLKETAELVLEAGVAGVNIEDSLEAGGALRGIDEQCERISVLRETANQFGVPLVINARIDSYTCPSFTREEATGEAVLRAEAYQKAGADCVFPMGPGDEATVRLLRSRIKGPLNILVTPAAAPLSLLREIGINRASFGPFIFRSCLRKFSEITNGILQGDHHGFSDMMSRAEVGDYLRVEREEQYL